MKNHETLLTHSRESNVLKSILMSAWGLQQNNTDRVAAQEARVSVGHGQSIDSF